MSSVIASTNNIGTLPAIASDLNQFRARITGEVILPGDAAYHEARQLHDFTFDHRPAIVVVCATSDDVAEAIRYARVNNLALSVRSGGHGLNGRAVMDGALVVDLSRMRSVWVDPQARIARVQAGATSGELAGAAHAYGLALSTGDTPSVGIAGLTLGGGIGWMVRKYGLAIDNLRSVEIVTAGGQVLRASEEVHPDLFWAIRGGGGNFSVITEFEFSLAPVGSIYGGMVVLPATREMVRGFIDVLEQAPDELTGIAQIMPAPPAPFIPEERVGEPVLLAGVVYAGDPEEGAKVIAPLRALGEPIADTVEAVPYPVIYAYAEAPAQRHGAHVRSGFAQELSDETIDAMLEAVYNATSPVDHAQIRVLGGAMARVPKGATAFGHRDAKYLLASIGAWMDPADDGVAHRAWAEKLWEEIRDATSGVYVNFIGLGEDRVNEAYPAETLQRLAEVKRRYDPANVFAGNQNIRPAR